MLKEIKNMWWIAVGVYLAFIYSTLGIAPAVWDGLNDVLAGKAKLLVYIVAFLACIFLLIYVIFVKKEKVVNRYLLLLLFIWAFIALNRLATRPVEKIHLIEYGFLSVLVYNALRKHLDPFDKRLYIYGCLFCFGAGLVDELIQLFLPNRVFDLRDVFFNTFASITVFLIIRFNILQEPQRTLQ